MAKGVVRIIESAVDDRAAGCVVDQMQHVSVGIVRVGRKCSIAVVLANQLTGHVVGISDDRYIVGVLEDGQTSDCVISVIHREIGLVNHLDPSATDVERELQVHAIGIVDSSHSIRRIIRKRDRSGGIDRRFQVSVGVVREVGVRAIGERLSGHLPRRVVDVRDRLSTAIGKRKGISKGVKSGRFNGTVGVGRAERIARLIIRIGCLVTIRIRQRCQTIVDSMCVQRFVPELIGTAGNISHRIVGVGLRLAGRVDDLADHQCHGVIRHECRIAQGVCRFY